MPLCGLWKPTAADREMAETDEIDVTEASCILMCWNEWLNFIKNPNNTLFCFFMRWNTDVLGYPYKGLTTPMGLRNIFFYCNVFAFLKHVFVISLVMDRQPVTNSEPTVTVLQDLLLVHWQVRQWWHCSFHENTSLSPTYVCTYGWKFNCWIMLKGQLLVILSQTYNNKTDIQHSPRWVQKDAEQKHRVRTRSRRDRRMR